MTADEHRAVRREIGHLLTEQDVYAEPDEPPRCLCGHPEDAHDDAGGCWLPLCGCSIYRPSGRREP